MKSVCKILLLSSVMAAFYSCEKYEESPSYESKTITKEHTWMIPMTSSGEYEITLLALSDFLDEDAAKTVTKAVLLSSSMEIVGLSKLSPTPALLNFRLNLTDSRKAPLSLDGGVINADNETFAFSNITSDRVFTDKETLEFFKTLFYFYNQMVKKTNLAITFTPTQYFNAFDRVYLKITFSGEFRYIAVVKK